MEALQSAVRVGAGEGNRTLLAGLGSQCITTMLRPRDYSETNCA
jgi:hypothetical protein